MAGPGTRGRYRVAGGGGPGGFRGGVPAGQCVTECLRGHDPHAGISQRPPVDPNEPLLQSALDQTQGAGTYDARSWRALVRARLQSFDMEAIAADARPFLERPADAALLSRDNLLGLLR